MKFMCNCIDFLKNGSSHKNSYHHEHNQGLGLKTCSFKVPGVLAFPELFLSNILCPLDRIPTFAGRVQWWGCHLKPLVKLVVPTLVWSLPFYLFCLVRPARSLSPCRHRSQDHRHTQALSPRQGKGATT
jgi:hypothetical protein